MLFRSADIAKPEDLRGKRVGTSRYGSTGLVFLRGMLEHDYGIANRDMNWCVGPLNDLSEKAAIPAGLPKDIRIGRAPQGRTLEEMFAAGELDALFSNYIPKLFLDGVSGIARLFPNFKDAERDYYRRTRIFPVMHIVVVRADFHRRHPSAAASLYRAFCAAKEFALEGLYDSDALHLALPWLLDHLEEAWRSFGRDYWSYGLETNRPAWDAVGRYLHEQGLSPRAPRAEELFAPDLE